MAGLRLLAVGSGYGSWPLAATSIGTGGVMADNETRQLIDSSVTWSLTLLAFLMVILKVLVVAHFDEATALGILQSAGPVSIVVAVITTSLGPLAILIIVGVNVVYRRGPPQGTERVVFETAFLIAIGLLFLVGGLVIVPALYLFLDLHFGWPVTKWITGWHAKHFPKSKEAREEARQRSSQNLILNLVQVALVFAITAASREPWIPVERIAVASSSNPDLVGYVLSDEAERTLVLQEDPRQLIWLDSTAIESRELCRMETPDSLSGWDYLWHSPSDIVARGPGSAEYPPCTGP